MPLLIVPLLVSVPTAELAWTAVTPVAAIFPVLVIEQFPDDHITAPVFPEIVPPLTQSALAASGVMLAKAAVKAKVSAVCLGY
jgi:hypothetical protein